jgi:hypothetical protein
LIKLKKVNKKSQHFLAVKAIYLIVLNIELALLLFSEIQKEGHLIKIKKLQAHWLMTLIGLKL